METAPGLMKIAPLPADGTKGKPVRGDGASRHPAVRRVPALSRVQLNDERFLDVAAELVAVGRLLEDAFELGRIDLHPVGHALALGQLHGVGDAELLLGLLAHGDGVAGLDRVRGDVDDLAVDSDAAVRDELARFGARRAEAHAIDDVIEARLEQAEQVRAGVALAALGFGEVAAELALENAVHALDLLLLAQLDAVVGRAGARSAAVLAGLRVELRLVADRP